MMCVSEKMTIVMVTVVKMCKWLPNQVLTI